MSTKEATVAVIGAGYWGPNLVRNFSLVDDVRVKYVCDLDQKKLDKLKKFHPGVIFVTDVNTVFADKEVDIVVIATPVGSHFALAKGALEAGKHVFVEKPITKTSKEAEELISIAKNNNLILHVDHTFLYYGPVRKIKEIIDSNELGELYYFDSQRINMGLIQKDINVIWDLAPHDVSILSFLYKKKPISVTAVGSTHVMKKSEELAHITIQYETGFIAHIHVSWLSPVKLRQMIIGGSKKMIYFDDIEPSEKIKIYDKGIDMSQVELDTFNPIYRTGDVHIPYYENDEALLRECEHFIDCVRQGKQTLTSGESGRDVVRILEAADESLRSGGKAVSL